MHSSFSRAVWTKPDGSEVLVAAKRATFHTEFNVELGHLSRYVSALTSIR